MEKQHTSGWAQELARNKRAEIEARDAALEQASSDRKRIESRAGDFWADLCQQLEFRVNELNTEWGQARLFVTFKDMTVEVSTAPDAEPVAASLQFNPRDFTLRVSFQGAELEVGVSRGNLVWRSKGANEEWSNEDIAKRTVEHVWRAIRE
jgi:hypothetical protein